MSPFAPRKQRLGVTFAERKTTMQKPGFSDVASSATGAQNGLSQAVEERPDVEGIFGFFRFAVAIVRRVFVEFA